MLLWWASGTGSQRSSFLTKTLGNCSHTTLGYVITELFLMTSLIKRFTDIVQEYKPPSSKDIPIDFRVELLKDAPNPIGVLGSKGVLNHVCWVRMPVFYWWLIILLLAVGEPPIALSSSVLFAVKRAVESARADAGNTEFFSLCKTRYYWKRFYYAPLHFLHVILQLVQLL